MGETIRYKGDSLIKYLDEYTIIDIETTGLDPNFDEIIEIGALKIADGKVIDEFSTLVKPTSLVSPFVEELTGINNKMLSDAPPIKPAIEAFYNFIGESILVGHNVHFDINFLYDNLYKYANILLQNDFVDTLRLARRLLPHLHNCRLSTIAHYFGINETTFHRALQDCSITFQCYEKLKNSNAERDEYFDSIKPNDINHPLYAKKCVVRGRCSFLETEEIESIISNIGGKVFDAFYKTADYLILSKTSFERFNKNESSWILDKARFLSRENNLNIISEFEFYEMCGMPIKRLKDSQFGRKKIFGHEVKAREIMPHSDDFDVTHPLYQKVCVFTGALQRMARREAMQMVVDIGGVCGDNITAKTNFLILGNNDYCKTIKDGKSNKQKKAEKYILEGKDIAILSENVFYDLIFENSENYQNA